MDKLLLAIRVATSSLAIAAVIVALIATATESMVLHGVALIYIWISCAAILLNVFLIAIKAVYDHYWHTRKCEKSGPHKKFGGK